MENLNQIPEGIQLLISDFLEGFIDEQGLHALNQWISESYQHLNQFNSFKSAWIISGKQTFVPQEKIETALDKIRDKLEAKPTGKYIPLRKFLKIAASWLLLLVIGGGIGGYVTLQTSGNENQLLSTSISAPFGSKSLVDLPDGTKIWLNAGSKITYDNKYGKSKREVHLAGEAFFDVKTNKKLPFLVNTSGVVVKATGTKFNVKAYPEEETITATLEEGKILITPFKSTSSQKPVELNPNEMATFYVPRENTKTVLQSNPKQENTTDKEKPPVIDVNSNIKTDLVTSWKDETWIIESLPLGVLAPVLERRYNIVIEFTSDEIKKYKFTGKVQKETIEQIMRALEFSAPIQYSFNKNTISLSINKIRKEQYKKYLFN